MSIRFLAGVTRKEYMDINNNNDMQIHLPGVLVDLDKFDYGYDNVDTLFTYLVREIPYRSRYDTKNGCDYGIENIIEFYTDIEHIEECGGWILHDMVVTDFENSVKAKYSIRGEDNEHPDFILTRIFSKSDGNKPLFASEYDCSWYRELWDDNMDGVNNIVKAKWSGEFPDLCQGIWYLAVNGVDVSDKIPDRNSQMDTYLEVCCGTHCEIEGCPDGKSLECEHCEGFSVNGKECYEWIESNKSWLNEISTDVELQKKIYEAIREEDFVAGTCGGCA